MADFAPEELERYRRHIILPEVGGPGQARLKQASVLVVGAGGLGSPLLMYLAAAGVGRIGIIDDDVVDLTNLQRQIVHGTPDIGRSKVESAAARLAAINPHVRVETHAERLTAANALEIIGRYDVVADGSDNFATRYLVSDACFFARRPLVWAAIGQFTGQLSVFKPHERDAEGRPLPGYRDLLPEPPPPGSVPSCAEAGVIGALPGVMGSLQAMEVLKEILGIGRSLAGWLLLYDGLDAEFTKVRLKWRPDNPLTGERPTIKDLSVHAKGDASSACGG
jgi:adenylyltransferase/sulfurtransferase